MADAEDEAGLVCAQEKPIGVSKTTNRNNERLLSGFMRVILGCSVSSWAAKIVWTANVCSACGNFFQFNVVRFERAAHIADELRIFGGEARTFVPANGFPISLARILTTRNINFR